MFARTGEDKERNRSMRFYKTEENVIYFNDPKYILSILRNS